MRFNLRLFLVLFLAWALSQMDLPVSFGQNQESNKDIPTIARDALKAVVLIIVSNSSGKEIKQGSGIVVSTDGRIITNFHVIEGGSSAMVKFPNGAFYLVEGLYAADKKNDIAVLKAAGSDFPVVALGDSDKVQVGEAVVSVGSPLALEATVSNGIISSVRDFKDDNLRIFQTTAPISPGSSGGALLNMRGEVIGITTAQLTGGQNLNFAIPINSAKSLLTVQSVKKMVASTGSEESQSTQSSNVPEMWTSLTSGHDFRIRLDRIHMYIERIFPPAFQQFVQEGAFFRCDLAQQGTKWVGTCSSYLPYQWVNKWTAITMTSWCRLPNKEEITIFTPTRIEGESEDFDPKDFDAAKCNVKKTEIKAFTWIPKI